MNFKPLPLSKRELKELDYNRYNFPSPIVQRRISAIYIKAVTGYSDAEVSKITGLHRNSVDRFISLYKEKGLQGVLRLEYGKRISDLEGYKGDIIREFERDPPKSSNEARQRLIKLTGIKKSPTQVRKFLEKHGFKYRKMGHIPAGVSAEHQEQFKKKHWLRQ